MKILFFIIISAFLLLSLPSSAQLKKADKYYGKTDYQRAAELYEKVLQKSENPQALEKIADCYRLLKDYPKAESFYARLMKLPNVAPINHFNYGMILRSNSKIEEAKEQFKIYAAAVPNDKKGALLIKSCNDILIWSTKAKQFDVSLISGINSKNSEFSPVLLKNQLVFVSDRINDLFSTGSADKQHFLHLYAVDMKSTKGGNAEFSEKINPLPWPVNSDFHDGPVCFNNEENTMYITHVELLVKKDKNFVNRTKLFISSLKDNKWNKLTAFPYNSDDYSVAHPSISSDGKTLFFASDMPGGEGGMDIYMCEKEGESWGKPVNLGSKVNTPGEEVFPYIRKDGMLFFSSTGLSGFGGLDIFSSSKNNGKYGNVKNLGMMINSPTDDFGIVFSDNEKGYFSSDRAAGTGSDDIYSFTALGKSLNISGKILQSKSSGNPAQLIDITLVSEDGKITKSSSTDKEGYFKFENLDPDKKYLIQLDETNAKSAVKTKYYLEDEKEVIIRQTSGDTKSGKLVFRNLPADPNAVSEVTTDGDVTFAGNMLYGVNPSKPLADTKVNLINDKGEIIQTVVTNAFGAFVFTSLPSDQNFIVRVDENDVSLPANMKIIVTNKSGKEIQATTTGKKGGFKFEFLSSDKAAMKLMKVEDTELRIDFKGKFVSDSKQPLANSTINLVNEKGEIIQTVKTDNNGNFKFTNLPSDQKIMFTFDEKDPQLTSFHKVFLTDSKDVVVKELVRKDGKFKLSILPSEKKILENVYVDDPWLKVLTFKSSAAKENLTIIEKVYYDYGKYKILPEAANILDKVVNIMENDPQLIIELSSHTDSRSSAEFNLKLSQQRADAAVEYIKSKGVAKNRITGKGYGESRLINKCADGVECTEEEHAKNRRTEFKVSRKQ